MQPWSRCWRAGRTPRCSDSASEPHSWTRIRDALPNTLLVRSNCSRDYSAAWKMLGKAHVAAGDIPGASAAFEQGIAVATSRGDVQAGKEMQVFLKRLKRRPLDH